MSVSAAMKKWWALAEKGFRLALVSGIDRDKFSTLRTASHYTQLNFLRLDNVYRMARHMTRAGVRGAFVECGVWKGGASFVLAHQARKEGAHRPVWMFDSFEGMPNPVPEDGRVALELAGNRADGALEPIHFNHEPSFEKVKEFFYQVQGFSPDDVHIVKGWFQHTLPEYKSRVGPIAILRLDGDFYESTKCSLEQLYPLVAEGGCVIVDDYNYPHFPGCKKAVDEFIAGLGEKVRLRRIDYSGVYFFRKGRP